MYDQHHRASGFTMVRQTHKLIPSPGNVGQRDLLRLGSSEMEHFRADLIFPGVSTGTTVCLCVFLSFGGGRARNGAAILRIQPIGSHAVGILFEPGTCGFAAGQRPRNRRDIPFEYGLGPFSAPLAHPPPEKEKKTKTIRRGRFLVESIQNQPKRGTLNKNHAIFPCEEWPTVPPGSCRCFALFPMGQNPSRSKSSVVVSGNASSLDHVPVTSGDQ